MNGGQNRGRPSHHPATRVRQHAAVLIGDRPAEPRVGGGHGAAAAAPALAAADREALQEDTDALHVLPLAIIPLKTPALARARLIKNSLLEGVVELFRDQHTGSGQCYPDDLPSRFRIDDQEDVALVKKLADLPSYDVYSLRAGLRRLGVAVDRHRHLRLSAAKQQALAPYMAAYVKPLVVRVYGQERTDVAGLGDIVQLFRTPDVDVALKNLRRLAASLDVPLEEVPTLLESYGDVYLSLSYYQHCLDEALPAIKNLLAAVTDLRANAQMRSERALQDTCRFVERKLHTMIADMGGLTDLFLRRTQDMWRDVSPESFRAMKAMIEGCQATVGGNLCVVTVKMQAWTKHFPSGHGALSKKASVLMSEMRPGLERIAPLDIAGRPEVEFV